MRSSWWIATVLVVVSMNAGQAHAKKSPKAKRASEEQGEKDDPNKPISVALLAGYGLAVDVPNDINLLGIGFGVRGGYNIDAIYLGARFMFFLGDSEEIAGVEVSANSITLGLEAGYDIALGTDVVIVRPEVGAGLVIASAEAMVSGAMAGSEAPIDDSSEDLYIAPGLAMLVRTGEQLFVGADVQLPIIFDSEILLELTILATGGMRF